MSSQNIKIFIECVHSRDVDGVLQYASQMSKEILKKMRLFANRNDYDEIVEIIDNEINSRD